MGDYGVQISNRFAALDLEVERPKRTAPKAIQANKPKPKPKQPATIPASALFPAVGSALPTRDARANKKAGPKGNKDRADKGPKAVKAIGGGDNKKRAFDKYSHSGKGQVPKEGKKHGGGRHNWGNAGDAERAALTPDDKVLPEENEKAPAAEGAAAEGEETVAAPDEPVQKSYEEFLAEQAAEQKRLKKEAAARSLRQAGEGEEGSAWANYERRKGETVDTGFVLRKKAKKPAAPAAAASSSSSTKTEERIGADKIFNITPAGDNAKRGRGGPRGARGARTDRPERSDEARAASSSSSSAAPAREARPRGEGRGRGARTGRGGAKPVSLDDKKAFPSLSSK